jgi:hypothetical protein
MRFVTSLYLDNRQMVVVVVADDNGTQIAYGVNPDQDPEQEQFEFIRQVTNLGGFLKAMVDGDEPGFQTNSVEIPSTPPPSPWPRLQVVISYAQAIHADEALAFHAA